MARMRARRMSATVWVTKAELLRSAINPAPRVAIPKRRTTTPSSRNATIGGDAPAVEGRDQLLAVNGWKTKRQDRIVGHGRCGSMRRRGQDGFDTQSLNALSILRHTRQPITDTL